MGKGKLVFKGEKPIKKKKRKSKHRTSSNTTATGEENTGDGIIAQTTTTVETTPPTTNAITEGISQQRQSSQTSNAPMVKIGQGKITSSGTVLMGHDTNFSSTLHAGDAIIAMIPISSSNSKVLDGKSGSATTSNRREEMRVITMSLSNNSAAISTAFSQDVKTPMGFRYIAKPRNVQKERMDRDKKVRVEKEETERSAFGIYNTSGGGTAIERDDGGGGGGQELVYRERTEHGGYRIRREMLHGGDKLTRN
eukprot:CAMPEP_0198261636 /NCGR_PEP_ID=MMETSP1447-20131203/10324_1 /TAXON_ID=420782 /ORGANISM="Chaetoceros dichaeta, Strain CCMP1751" /LENGTH=251 /DNA_ID=CAMNT_0043949617 /DNA_START=77 /DNA_END=829 /DNA_ORIENTATION=+